MQFSGEVSLRTFAAELAGLISQMPRCHMPGMQASLTRFRAVLFKALTG